MNDNVIIAVLGVIASFIGSASLINWRLQSLERKVEEHNGYAKLFSEYSKCIAVIQTDIAYIKKEIDKRG